MILPEMMKNAVGNENISVNTQLITNPTWTELTVVDIYDEIALHP
jgi:hypothetical protein